MINNFKLSNIKNNYNQTLTIIFIFINLTINNIFMCHAQILTFEPETDDNPQKHVIKYVHSTLTLSGTTGLLTIPTPDINNKTIFGITYKGCNSENNVTINQQIHEISKKEHYTGLFYNIKPNLELSFMHLRYNRSSNPYINTLNYSEDSTAFGIKYSTKNFEQDLCMGLVFAPMTSDEISKADLSQIELLRSIYITISEEIYKNFYGYLHLKESFTKEQSIILTNNRVLKRNVKNFLTSGIGLEYIPNNSLFSIFLEGKFTNYRDIFKDEATRFTLNAGIRLGNDKVFAEIIGASLQNEPYLILGSSMSF